VIGSRVNAKELADRVGLSYEQFTAGEYKDAGTPLKELDDSEREYLQTIVDGYYDQFVETVADGRQLDEDEIRETEARIYLGGEAHELGLVDQLGTRREIEDTLEAELGEPVTVQEFEPTSGLAGRLRGGAQSVAFALGAGMASTLNGDFDGLSFRR
jgi:protease-4